MKRVAHLIIYAPKFIDALQFYAFNANRDMLFTPNFLLAPRAFSEMN
jgi:hypothetical protein